MRKQSNNTLKTDGQLFIGMLYWDKVFVLIILQNKVLKHQFNLV